MTSNHLLTAIATVAVLAGAPAWAGDQMSNDQTGRQAVQDEYRADAGSDRRTERKHRDHDRHSARAALQVVPNSSLPDQPSYGWQYYSNSRAKVAVVISPAGEYFLSRGDGPRQITGPAGEALMTSTGQD